jgi:RimJ/RimL family protein N-acetyltransferase
LEPAKYQAVETLRDGRQFGIRALRPDDQAGLLEAVRQSSAESLYRRFFSPKRGFTEAEIAYFVEIDFLGHVALVATLEERCQSMIIGGGRYVLVEPKKAEVAFVVVDRFQGQGVGTALVRHLARIASDAGLEELMADVLPDNTAMLRAFERSGLRATTAREGGVAHVRLQLCRSN